MKEIYSERHLKVIKEGQMRFVGFFPAAGIA